MSTKNYKTKKKYKIFFEIDNFIIFADWRKKPKW